MKNGRLLPLTLWLLATISVATTIWVGYMEVLDQLVAVNAEVKSMQLQVAAVKSSAAARKDFIPPLFGSKHIALRQRFALEQINQANENFAIIIGDSIIEGIYLPTLAGLPVVNAGMGGAGISDVNELLTKVNSRVTADGILIAIGINDAMHSATSDDYFNQWKAALKKAIYTAKTLAADRVAVSTVIPAEGNKPLGKNYFDSIKVEKINKLIRQACAETMTTLVDQEPSFHHLARSGIEYTTDGIHLNEAGYKLMKDNIRNAVHW